MNVQETFKVASLPRHFVRFEVISTSRELGNMLYSSSLLEQKEGEVGDDLDWSIRDAVANAEGEGCPNTSSPLCGMEPRRSLLA